MKLLSYISYAFIFFLFSSFEYITNAKVSCAQMRCGTGYICIDRKRGNRVVGKCKALCSIKKCDSDEYCSTTARGYGKCKKLKRISRPWCKNCKGKNYECFDNPYDECRPDCLDLLCPGICGKRAEYEMNDNDDDNNKEVKKYCGGINNIECDDGYICVDRVGDRCNPMCNKWNSRKASKYKHSDCLGICIKPRKEVEPVQKEPKVICQQRCNCMRDRLIGRPCFQCVDNPTDNCNPDCGDRKCPGICARYSLNGPKECYNNDKNECPKEFDLCVDTVGDNCNKNCDDNNNNNPNKKCLGQCMVKQLCACTADIAPNGGYCCDGNNWYPNLSCAACDGFTQDHCQNRKCEDDKDKDDKKPVQPTLEPTYDPPVCDKKCKCDKSMLGEPCYKCVDDPSDDCNPDCGDKKCPGICAHYGWSPKRQECGNNNICPKLFNVCVDELGDNCNEKCNGKECKKYCVITQKPKPKEPEPKKDPPVVCSEKCECDKSLIGAPCFKCMDDPNDDCNPDCGDVNCPGICAHYGWLPKVKCSKDNPCNKPFDLCVDDINDKCNEKCNGENCDKYCVITHKKAVCQETCRCDRKLLGEPCHKCVDDPNDNCNPDCGDKDCPGICAHYGWKQKEECSNNKICPKLFDLCVDELNDNCNEDCDGESCKKYCMIKQKPMRTTNEPKEPKVTKPTEEQSPKKCDKELKKCSDGTHVGRNPNHNCHHYSCNQKIDPSVICSEKCECNADLIGGECFKCVDDPNDDCDPDCGDRRCKGICARRGFEPKFCTSKDGNKCPDGFDLCLDEMGDNCSEKCGNSECKKYCAVVQKKDKPKEDDAGN